MAWEGKVLEWLRLWLIGMFDLGFHLVFFWRISNLGWCFYILHPALSCSFYLLSFFLIQIHLATTNTECLVIYVIACL